ncbi:MAG: glycosyl hydrolase 108 family protein [Actinomycetota bacterium]
MTIYKIQHRDEFDFRLVTWGAVALTGVYIWVPPVIQSKPVQQAIAALTGNNYFDKALSFSLKWEGGYSNVNGDAGGRTWRGVTEEVARRHGFSDPRQLSDEKIKQIYQSDYWKPAKCSRFKTFAAALTCLDTAINYGAAFQSLSYFVGCPESDEKQWALCVVRQRKTQRDRQAARPLQAKFLQGWLNRDEALENLISKF